MFIIFRFDEKDFYQIYLNEKLIVNVFPLILFFGKIKDMHITN